MKRLASRVVLGFTALLPTVSVGAQAQPSPSKWSLGWKEGYCTLSTGSMETLGISLWQTPGDPRPILYVAGSPGLLPDPGKKVTVQLSPSGETFPVDVYKRAETAKSRVLSLSGLGYKFPEAFARSTELRLVGGPKPVSITMANADKAVAGLRQQCIDRKLPDWGIDPQRYHAMREPPVEVEGSKSWPTEDDYPPEALDASQTGRVVVRVVVDATGKVIDCATAASSGAESLDDITCRVVRARGQFHPAIGPDGRPTVAAIIRVVRY